MNKTNDLISRRDAFVKVADEDDDRRYESNLNVIRSGVIPLSSEFSTPVELGKINPENIDDYMNILVVATEAQAAGLNSPMMVQAKKMLAAWNKENA